MSDLAFLCNSNSWGGLEMNILNILKWIQSEGKQVILFCPPHSKIAHQAQQAGIAVYPFKQKIKFIDFSAAYRIVKTLKLLKIRHLFLSQSKEIATGVLVKLWAGKEHGLRLIYFQQMMIGIKKKDWLHNFMYQKLDSWIVPLPTVVENVLRYTQLPNEKIELIPLCIETERFIHKKHTKAEARKMFHLPEEGLIVGIVGRIDRQKGQDFLIKALHIIKQKGISFCVVFFGEETKGEEGTYLPYLQSLVNELGLEDLVFFRPFVEDTSVAYACLDVFVMASWQETFGMVTIEAMATGLPVVGAYSGGTKDLIKEYQNGLFFDAKSPDSLALQLIKLIKSNKLRDVLASNALESVKSQFSHNVFLNNMSFLMKKLQ